MLYNAFPVWRPSFSEIDVLCAALSRLIKEHIYRCINQNSQIIKFLLSINLNGNSSGSQKHKMYTNHCKSTLRSLSVFHSYGLEKWRSKVDRILILATPPSCSCSEKPACPFVDVCKICNIFFKSREGCPVGTNYRTNINL